MDLADARVDTKLSILKPLHAKSLVMSYEFFRSEEGKNNILSGWRAAGISKAFSESRETGWNSVLDPFSNLRLEDIV